jgi:hypothetical protein
MLSSRGAGTNGEWIGRRCEMHASKSQYACLPLVVTRHRQHQRHLPIRIESPNVNMQYLRLRCWFPRLRMGAHLTS